jgi:epoxyqueuosine reductase
MKCLSYWTQSAKPMPPEYESALGPQVYGCDICQDVCPWNRGVEKRRANDPLPDGAEPHVDLVEWLEADPDLLRRRYQRLYVPRNDGRFLQRNAAIALANEQVEAGITSSDTCAPQSSGSPWSGSSRSRSRCSRSA